MNFPFTPQQFFDVFTQYNRAVWPLQIIFFVIALAAAVAVCARPHHYSRLALYLLAALWLWVAVVYHFIFFRAINQAAIVFAVLFAVESVLLVVAAARNSVLIRPQLNITGVIGAFIVMYALLDYPILGYAFGHRFPSSPTFGLPCPTTIYTIGMLLWMRPLRFGLFVVPVLWSLIGFTAALKLGVYEDTGLLVSAVIAVALVLYMRTTQRGGVSAPASM